MWNTVTDMIDSYNPGECRDLCMKYFYTLHPDSSDHIG